MNFTLKSKIKSLRWKINYFKLWIIFNKNDDSGRLIPVNELTRGIGKTTILIKRVLKENNSVMVVKHRSTKKHISLLMAHEALKSKKIFTDWGYKEIPSIYTYDELLLLDDKTRLLLSVYTDECMNSEEILLLKSLGVHIKNGFMYCNSVRSPLEFKGRDINE